MRRTNYTNNNKIANFLTSIKKGTSDFFETIKDGIVEAAESISDCIDDSSHSSNNHHNMHFSIPDREFSYSDDEDSVTFKW